MPEGPPSVGPRTSVDFRAILEMSGVPIVQVDLTTQRIQLLNDAFCRMLGYGRDELIGHSVLEFTHPDDRAHNAAEMRKLAERVIPQLDVEKRYLKKDGTVCWVHVCARLTTAPGDPPLTVAVLQDVTARRISEASLVDARRHAETALAQLRAVIDSIPEVIVIAGADGRVLHHNRAALEMFGLTDATELTRPIPEVAERWRMFDLEGRAIPLEERPMSRALRGERFTNYELVVRNGRTGRDLVASYSGSAVRDEAGQVMLAILSTRDITERKRAEQELARQLAEITAIYDSAPVGLGVLDRDLRYVRVNERLAQINGPSVAAHLGRTVFEVVPDLGRTAAAAFQQILDTGQPRLDVEIVGETPARPGEQRAWIEQWVPLKDAHGHVVGINVVADEVTDRKRAEAERERLIGELQRQRDFLGKLVERLPVGVAVVSGPELNVDLVNPAYAEIAGVTDEVVGRSIRELFTATLPDTFEHLSRAVLNGRPWEFHELESRLPSGSRWWSGWAVPLSATPGNAPSALVIVQDMTATVVARRAAEQLAREAEGNLAQLQAVVNSMTEGLTIADPSGYIISMNEAALRIHGFESLEHARRHLTEYPHLVDVRTLDDEPLPVSEWPISLALAGHTFSGFELLVRRIDSGHAWVGSYGGAPVRDRSGQVLLGINTVRDITKEREATVALRQSERRYRTLVDAAPVFVWHLDNQGRLTYSSEQFLKYTGATAGQASTWNISDNAFVHPDEQPLLVSRWRESVVQASPFEVEARLRGADGTYCWHLTRVAPMLDEKRDVSGWVAASVDIDQRKRAEERLREADRLKDQFLVMLSHEMRQPLNALRAAAHVARLSADSDRVMRPLEIVDRQVTHLAHLVDDLTDASRIKRGRLFLQRSPCDLRHVVEGAIEAVRPILASNALVLDVDLPPAPVHVLGDPNRLNQVLINLLSNAAKNTPARGRIEVELCMDGAEAVLQVRDTGRGIDPAHLPRLFELFFQGSEAEPSGMGIGLALVKGLVELHDGRVEVASGGPGQGAAFTVRIPLSSTGTAVAP